MVKGYIIIFFSHELKKEFFNVNHIDPFTSLGESNWILKTIDTNQPVDSIPGYKGENYIFEKTFDTIAQKDADYFYRTLGQYYIYPGKNDFDELLGF